MKFQHSDVSDTSGNRLVEDSFPLYLASLEIVGWKAIYLEIWSRNHNPPIFRSLIKI